MHFPWSDFDDCDGPKWLMPEDEGSHQQAFLRLAAVRTGVDAKDTSTADGAGDDDVGPDAAFFAYSSVYPQFEFG